MKFLRISLVFSLAAACTGNIDGTRGGGGDSDPSTKPDPVDPGHPTDPGNTKPPGGMTNPPPPDMTPPGSVVGKCTVATLAKPRVWRLTHAQLKNTLKDTLGFTPPSIASFPAEARIDKDDSRNGYANRADAMEITPLLADSYFKASEELANEVVAKTANYGLNCALASIGTGSCLRDFLTGFGAKMWRRPLTGAELDSFTALYNKSAGQGDGAAGGVRNLVQALFLSPSFLYRSELGGTPNADGVVALTDYELASSLSYTLWDSAPDPALYQLAVDGKLRDKAVLLGEAKRLLAATDKSAASMQSFVQQWLHLESMLGSPKDPAIFSTATPQVGADLLEELRLFFNSVVFDPMGDRSFKTLFTASYGFVNSRTAPLYGVQGVTGTALVKKDFPAGERKGLLTQAAFLWGHANSGGTHPIERGRYFREEVLCTGVPDPPPTVIVDPAFGNATLTARERLTIHEKEPACAACHTLIDGYGLAMENYDGIGRYRKQEIVMGGTAKNIDPSGTIPLPSTGDEINFSNYVDLIDKLSAKPDVFTCFASQYLDYSTGRKPGENASCEQDLITADFVSSGYKVDTLVLGVIGSPSFMARKN
jgi:hypothetical protein